MKLVKILLGFTMMTLISTAEEPEELEVMEKQSSFLFNIDREILRDYSFNFLNFILNWVGTIVHQIILQIFLS